MLVTVSVIAVPNLVVRITFGAVWVSGLTASIKLSLSISVDALT